MTTETCLADEQLYAAADGDTTPSAQEHLANCAACRDRVEKLQSEMATIRRLFSRPFKADDAASTERRQRPTFLGKYFLAGVANEDDQLIVYRGVHSLLQAEVVLYRSKTPLTDDQARELLVTECRRIGELRHPAIARVLDVEVDDDLPCLVVEHVDDERLEQYVSRARPTLQQLAHLGADLADALAAAHRIGVRHGCLTGDSIVVSPDGSPHIVDFGVVHLRRLAEQTSESMPDDLPALGKLLNDVVATKGESASLKKLAERAMGGDFADVSQFASALRQSTTPPGKWLVIVVVCAAIVAAAWVVWKLLP